VAGFKFERDLLREGCRSVAGVDECGRGSLFGPVVAAAIILPSWWCLRRPPAWARRINDSKLLQPTKRMELGALLLSEAEALGIGMASSAEIDERNIFWASQMAMKRAVKNLSRPVDVLLVDGFALKDVEYRQMGIPQGDRTCMSIAAASIVAKVFRDGLMDEFDAVYAGYGLARNKGYGTEEHLRSLRARGPTGLHRMSFKLG
jgi:ribonuclease HII